ncbi:hypothetical protein [Aquibaculum sediminis]|uniref:hypothetical protein n=1 Tax=Aquibaculum sediminis TaxID=3231907 RepID=UPI003452C27D
MANDAVDKELQTLRGDLDTLREDVKKLTEQLSRTAKSGASAASEEAQAELSRLRAELDELYGRAVSGGQASIESMERQVERHPLASLAAAFGVGLLLGKLLDRN